MTLIGEAERGRDLDRRPTCAQQLACARDSQLDHERVWRQADLCCERAQEMESAQPGFARELIVTIEPPAATCTPMCRSGGCPVTFQPNPATVAVDVPVFWKNLDSVAHTLMNASTGNTPLTAAPANGMSGGIKFTQTGTYTIGAMDCENPQSTGYLARHQIAVTVN